MSSNRFVNNQLILDKITEKIYKHPEVRFTKILHHFGLEQPDFDEESSETLKRINFLTNSDEKQKG